MGALPQAYMHIAPAKKRKVGIATFTNLTWEKNFGARLRVAVGIGGGGIA